MRAQQIATLTKDEMYNRLPRFKYGEVKAYCTSFHCLSLAENVNDIKTKPCGKNKPKGTKKNVSISTIFCPACGHALYWTRDGISEV